MKRNGQSLNKPLSDETIFFFHLEKKNVFFYFCCCCCCFSFFKGILVCPMGNSVNFTKVFSKASSTFLPFSTALQCFTCTTRMVVQWTVHHQPWGLTSSNLQTTLPRQKNSTRQDHSCSNNNREFTHRFHRLKELYNLTEDFVYVHHINTHVQITGIKIH